MSNACLKVHVQAFDKKYNFSKSIFHTNSHTHREYYTYMYCIYMYNNNYKNVHLANTKPYNMYISVFPTKDRTTARPTCKKTL